MSQYSSNWFSLIVYLWYTNRNRNMGNEMSTLDYETRDLGSLTDSNYICPRDRKILSHASLPASLSCPLALLSSLSCFYQSQMPENGSSLEACVIKQLVSLKLLEIVRSNLGSS